MRVLLTGATSPIGQEIAVNLAKKGYDLVLQYCKNQEKAIALSKTCAEYSVKTDILQADFSRSEGIESFTEKYLTRYSETFGFINNASRYLLKGPLETTLEDFDKILSTNLCMPFAVTRSLAPLLKKQKGFIVHVGVAGLGAFRADTYSTAYTLSKQALYSLTKSFAKELAKDTVRVNMLSLGYFSYSLDLPDLQSLPMKKVVSSQEFIKALFYLIDSENQSLTGHNLELSGAVRL